MALEILHDIIQTHLFILHVNQPARFMERNMECRYLKNYLTVGGGDKRGDRRSAIIIASYVPEYMSQCRSGGEHCNHETKAIKWWLEPFRSLNCLLY